MIIKVQLISSWYCMYQLNFSPTVSQTERNNICCSEIGLLAGDIGFQWDWKQCFQFAFLLSWNLSDTENISSRSAVLLSIMKQRISFLFSAELTCNLILSVSNKIQGSQMRPLFNWFKFQHRGHWNYEIQFHFRPTQSVILFFGFRIAPQLNRYLQLFAVQQARSVFFLLLLFWQVFMRTAGLSSILNRFPSK